MASALLSAALPVGTHAAAPSVVVASELVVDAVIEPDSLRAELVRRYALAVTKDRSFATRRNPITPA